MHGDTDIAFENQPFHGIGHEITYAGALSFLRRAYSKDVHSPELIVSGVPFDLAVSNRPGTRFGPRSIREASTNLAWTGGPWPWGFDPFENILASDFGDCVLDQGKPDKIPQQIEEHARLLLSGGAKMLTMGGDHFVTYPILKAIHERHGPVSLVHFDAHSDTWEEPEERIDHGTMFYHAARQGLVNPQKSVQIGLRTCNDKTHGFNIMDADYVHKNGVQKVIENTLEIVGDNPAYLTFDIDCLDPSYAPGTGTPVCGGLSTWQAQTIIRGLVPINFISMDLVEVAPAYDVGDITSLAGASIMLDFICLLSQQKR
jgi:agmatinase